MLAERIRDLRVKAGDSQEALAEKCAVSQITVSRWESGQREPRAEELCAIADAYDVTTDYLVGRSPSPSMYAHPIGEINGQGATYFSPDKTPLTEADKARLVDAAQSPTTVVIKPTDELPKDRKELEAFVRRLISEASNKGHE